MLDPDVEAAPWADQQASDEAVYRRQIAYLFARSRFYRDKLTSAGFKDAEAVGGLADIAALPFTEKDELRASRSRGRPDRHASGRADGRNRAHLLDQRHHRRAELHSADGGRPRRLGAHLGAQLRGGGTDRRHPPGLDLQCRSLRRRHRPRRLPCPRPLPCAGRLGQHRPPDGGGDPPRHRSGRPHPLLCAASGRMGAPARHRPSRLFRPPTGGCRRAGRRRAGHARQARGRLGRQGQRGDGHRRHRRHHVGRMRGAGRHAFQRPRPRSFRADRPGDGGEPRRSPTAPRANWSTPTLPSRRRRCCASAAATMSGCGPAPAPAGAPARASAASAAPTTC